VGKRVVIDAGFGAEHGRIAIINGITKYYPMDTTEDVLGTNASRALTNFKFQ